MLVNGVVKVLNLVFLFINWRTGRVGKASANHRRRCWAICELLCGITLLTWGSVVVFSIYHAHGWSVTTCPVLLYHFAIAYLAVAWLFVVLACLQISPYTL